MHCILIFCWYVVISFRNLRRAAPSQQPGASIEAARYGPRCYLAAVNVSLTGLMFSMLALGHASVPSPRDAGTDLWFTTRSDEFLMDYKFDNLIFINRNFLTSTLIPYETSGFVIATK